MRSPNEAFSYASLFEIGKMMKPLKVEERYKKLSDVEHVLLRPGRYIGNINSIKSKEYIFNSSDKKFEEKDTEYVPAVLKLFDEIFSNAIDESKRNKKLDKIRVEIDKQTGWITVWDNGGIPVEIHKEHDQYIPEMIFTELKAGSNFNDKEERVVTGTHGEGSTLSLIFSKEAQVKTCDGKKQFKQTYKNNLSEKSEPQIKDKVREGFTEISFLLDYERLNTSLTEGNYTKLIRRIYEGAACNPNLTFWINGEKIKINSFKDFVQLHTDDFLFEESSGLSVGISASSGAFEHVSFVNGTETKIGGIHIDAIINPIVEEVRNFLNKKHKVDLKPGEIKSHFKLFLTETVINPQYSSQTKEQLIGGKLPEFKPSQRLINSILNSNILESIIDWIKAKEEMRRQKELKNLDKEISGNNPRRILKLTDASKQGDRSDCILFITEGLSASLAIKSIRDPVTMGCYALKGKPINVSGVEPKKLSENAEFKELCIAIGLQIGKKVESVSDLRYGKIAFLTDADFDAYHINGLLINMFYTYWPELFDLKVIHRFITPAVKIFMNKTETWFYTEKEFKDWVETHKQDKFTSKYYKGLGTSTSKEFKEYLNKLDILLKEYKIQDDTDRDIIDLCMNKTRAEDRKVWLTSEE